MYAKQRPTILMLVLLLGAIHGGVDSGVLTTAWSVEPVIWLWLSTLTKLKGKNTYDSSILSLMRNNQKDSFCCQCL